MKENDDFLILLDGLLDENDDVIARYAREEKMKQEESVSPTASA